MKDLTFMKDYDCDNFNKNPVILFNHDYKSIPIGKVDNGNPVFVDWYKMVEDGIFEFDPAYIKHEDGRLELCEISLILSKT